jgi:hypothetical protein
LYLVYHGYLLAFGFGHHLCTVHKEGGKKKGLEIDNELNWEDMVGPTA